MNAALNASRCCLRKSQIVRCLEKSPVARRPQIVCAPINWCCGGFCLPDNGRDATVSAFNGFATMIGSVRELSGRMGASADFLAGLSENASCILGAQSEQVDQTAATDQMTATIREVTGNAHAAFESAVSVITASGNGYDNVRQAIALTESTTTSPCRNPPARWRMRCAAQRSFS